MGNPTTATIETSNGPVVVHKLVISQYAELLGLFQGMPAIVSELGLSSKDDWTDSKAVGAKVPVLMMKALPEMAKLLAFPTDQEASFFMDLDLADVLDITDGILSVNDFERIVASIKKISGRSKNLRPATPASQPTPTTGSTPPSTS